MNDRGPVLFCVGGGGAPERHAQLISFIEGHGYRVIAPAFERLTSKTPTEAELIERPLRCRDALVDVSTPVQVIGHSIGGYAALCLAGGEPWLREGRKLDVVHDARVKSLLLMAPAAGFFGGPGSLDAVQVPTLVLAAEHDAITPRWQMDALNAELHVEAGAGHFSFLDPEQGPADPPGFDRSAFHERLRGQVLQWLEDHR